MHGAPYLELHDLPFLVDTGANVSMLTYNWYMGIPDKHRPELAKSPLQTFAGNQSKFNVMGVARFDQCTKNLEYQCWMHVSPNEKFGVLGMDFMTHHKLTINPSKHKISVIGLPMEVLDYTGKRTTAVKTVHLRPKRRYGVMTAPPVRTGESSVTTVDPTVKSSESATVRRISCQSEERTPVTVLSDASVYITRAIEDKPRVVHHDHIIPCLKRQPETATDIAWIYRRSRTNKAPPSDAAARADTSTAQAPSTSTLAQPVKNDTAVDSNDVAQTSTLAAQIDENSDAAESYIARSRARKRRELSSAEESDVKYRRRRRQPNDN